ncbi:MAG: U32 family peptidase, partial [Turicibacter sp.]|nr:U32 family peptidase [Turicibacter sp.]
MKKIELLSPAGDFEKLQTAIHYGADAVYLGAKSFGLRAGAKNFDHTEIAKAVEYAHAFNVKVYVAANIFAHNSDIDDMQGFFATLQSMAVDACIISDLGVLSLARSEAPNMEIHVSTQANTTNYKTAEIWRKLGASRIILARELNLTEISETVAKAPNIDFEAFVHGAMCMSYSGRCMLSRYMSNRDANLGACTQPCRYKYRLYAEEATRLGEFMPLEETQDGTDIFSAEDLCMIEYLPALLDTGLVSLKIEGRMKTAFYVATTTLAYRLALDALAISIAEYEKILPHCLELLKMPSHRPFSTGFYFNKPQKTTSTDYTRTHDFIGIVRQSTPTTTTIEQRGLFQEGDPLSFIKQNGEIHTITAQDLRTPTGEKTKRAPHPQQPITLPTTTIFDPLTIVCRGPGPWGS